MATSCFMVWSGKIQVISSQCSHVSDTLSTAVGVEMSTPICMSVCLHTRYDRCWLTGTSPAHQGRASEGWRWAWGEKKKERWREAARMDAKRDREHKGVSGVQNAKQHAHRKVLCCADTSLLSQTTASCKLPKCISGDHSFVSPTHPPFLKYIFCTLAGREEAAIRIYFLNAKTFLTQSLAGVYVNKWGFGI